MPWAKSFCPFRACCLYELLIIQHAYSFKLKNSLNIWKLLNFKVSLQKNKTYQDKGIKTYPCKGIKEKRMKQVEERYTPQELREYEASKIAYRDIKNSVDTAKREGIAEGLVKKSLHPALAQDKGV